MNVEKTQPGVSVRKSIWTQFKNTTDNASQQLEHLMESYVDGSGFDDEDEIDEEIQKLERQIERDQEQIESLKNEITQKKNRISTLEDMKENAGLPDNHDEYMDNAFQILVVDARDERGTSPGEKFRRYAGGQHDKYCQHVEDIDFATWKDRFKEKLEDEGVDSSEVM